MKHQLKKTDEREISCIKCEVNWEIGRNSYSLVNGTDKWKDNIGGTYVTNMQLNLHERCDISDEEYRFRELLK